MIQKNKGLLTPNIIRNITHPTIPQRSLINQMMLIPPILPRQDHQVVEHKQPSRLLHVTKVHVDGVLADEMAGGARDVQALSLMENEKYQRPF